MKGLKKKLEIDFTYFSAPKTKQEKLGLRNVSQDEWSEMLKFAHCEIVGTTSNDFFDSFVLSESSLFVYPTKLMIKTCGTTTLLKILDSLFEIAEKQGLQKSFVCYSRKNFNFPQVQKSPHTGFDEEVSYLDKYFDGFGFILGPQDGDHWYTYVADYNDSDFTLSQEPEITLEICMHDLSDEKMKQFFKSKDFISGKHVTESSGINKLIPGSIIEEFQFDPCGYSMNGLLNESYSTIHITPESHCSFVSYDTNITKSSLEKAGKTFQDLINDVIHTFEPKRFSVTVFADDHSLNLDTKTYNVFDERKMKEFKVQSKSFYEFDQSYSITHATFIKV